MPFERPSADPAARQVVARLLLSDGSEYDFGRIMIEAGELLQIDLGRIQRESVPDPASRVLPGASGEQNETG